MQFVDLAAQQDYIRDQVESNIRAVLDHGKYIMGPEVGQFESLLAEYVGSRFCVTCSSGTDALLMALMACGVGSGDAVFTSPFTFIATAEVISLLGATPVFVDIDPATYNVDPVKLEFAIQAVKKNDRGLFSRPGDIPLRPRAIIPVDLFGLPADYEAINRLGEAHGLVVIEDAAQSLGASYQNRRAGGLADMGCTSFFPAKPLGGYGDGGAVFTDDDRLAQSLQSIRVHGKGEHKYDNARIGINGRLDTIQAAVLLAKFDVFPWEIERRQEVAQRYSEMLSPLSSDLRLPVIPENSRSAWAQYSLLAKNADHRQSLQDRLKDHGIPSVIYYPKPLHLQSAFASLGYRQGDMPVSEESAQRIFSLPMHPYLKLEEQEAICACLAGNS